MVKNIPCWETIVCQGLRVRPTGAEEIFDRQLNHINNYEKSSKYSKQLSSLHPGYIGLPLWLGAARARCNCRNQRNCIVRNNATAHYINYKE